MIYPFSSKNKKYRFYSFRIKYLTKKTIEKKFLKSDTIFPLGIT